MIADNGLMYIKHDDGLFFMKTGNCTILLALPQAHKTIG